jgi:hypothetical protein
MAATMTKQQPSRRILGQISSSGGSSYSVQIELGETLKKRKRMPIITSVG